MALNVLRNIDYWRKGILTGWRGGNDALAFGKHYMEIIVEENYAIRSAYASAKVTRYFYIVPIVLFFAALSTCNIYWIVPFALSLFIFGYVFLCFLRIASFSDDTFTSSWPHERVRAYEEIRRIINLSPYEEILFCIIIVYKKGILFKKINIAWIPTDQGILEHLKARGVKVWNIWFGQEK